MCGIFMDREQLAERFAEAASMPRDVVMGASVITITGRNEICIENYRGILEYTPSDPCADQIRSDPAERKKSAD